METAVAVQDAVKALGGNLVLRNFNMQVPRGAIYGLLGASGCGKTTLLGCIVGSRTLDSGQICVLGANPPGLGALIGYMPQDIALVGELSCLDCAMFFGAIYGMSEDEICAKYDVMERLLQLPKRSHFIKNLSGGQQRRVSLAVSLIHDPPLVILDEPTVGLDPVLRQAMWEYLLDLARRGTSVLITTHYIEEARQAHTIGLMRNGCLLEEGSPAVLIHKYNATSIESVFLALSANQDQGLQKVETGDYAATPVPVKHSPRFTSTSPARAKALIRKNILRIIRHPGGLLFSFVLPLLEICTFFLSVGGIPDDLRLAVVNQELSAQQHCSHPSYIVNNSCQFTHLSCSFLADLHDSIETKYVLEYFNSTDEAMAVAKHGGHILAVLHFGQNFTTALEERYILGKDSSDQVLEDSGVEVWIDMTDGQMAFLFQQQVTDTYSKFASDVMMMCGRESRAAQVPVRFMEPVYGIRGATYNAYIAPGVLVTLVFFLAVTVSSIIIIVERDEGVWERSLVAGVSTNEVLLSHTVTQGLVMTLQTAEVLLVSFLGFQLRCVGSYGNVTFLLLIQGLCGMSAGLAISVFCNTVTASNLMAMGSFVPVIFLSGSLWPVEGMPQPLRWFAAAMPTTLATQGLRDVMEKGWGLGPSCVVPVAWTAVFAVFSCVVLNYKSR